MEVGVGCRSQFGAGFYHSPDDTGGCDYKTRSNGHFFRHRGYEYEVACVKQSHGRVM
jgi:hypothetical protein